MWTRAVYLAMSLLPFLSGCAVLLAIPIIPNKENTSVLLPHPDNMPKSLSQSCTIPDDDGAVTCSRD